MKSRVRKRVCGMRLRGGYVSCLGVMWKCGMNCDVCVESWRVELDEWNKKCVE